MLDEHVYSKIESWVHIRKWLSRNLGRQVGSTAVFLASRLLPV
jgi:hypothetical protein